MKKLFSIAILVASGTLMFTTSCKKTKNNGPYTCTCTYKGSITGGDTTTKSVYPTGVSQSEASSDCSAAQAILQPVDPTAKCGI